VTTERISKHSYSTCDANLNDKSAWLWLTSTPLRKVAHWKEQMQERAGDRGIGQGVRCHWDVLMYVWRLRSHRLWFGWDLGMLWQQTWTDSTDARTDKTIKITRPDSTHGKRRIQGIVSGERAQTLSGHGQEHNRNWTYMVSLGTAWDNRDSRRFLSFCLRYYGHWRHVGPHITSSIFLHFKFWI